MLEVRNIVILTGAGISAESGVPTFRTEGGVNYWNVGDGHDRYRVEDVCTPEALARDADLVHRFYDLRRAALATVAPNAAHDALAQLDRDWPGELLIVTQNVDDLHERAGAKRLIHMHGELNSALCADCGERRAWAGDLPPRAACPACGAPALRPDIVFFGEMPYDMNRIDRALAMCDLFVSIGTSGAIYPAAGFVRTARNHGADTLELNLDASRRQRLVQRKPARPGGIAGAGVGREYAGIVGFRASPGAARPCGPLFDIVDRPLTPRAPEVCRARQLRQLIYANPLKSRKINRPNRAPCRDKPHDPRPSPP